MAKFNPQPNDTIAIDGEHYTVTHHPAVPTMAFGQEGRKATVYQLKQNEDLFALKIFKRPFREERLVDTCDVLSTLQLDGLEVCNRQCFTHQSYGSVLQQYPDMEYAILMPWVDGSTWFDIVFASRQINEDSSKKLAKSTADVLATLESQGFAHCDVAGANVMVDTYSGHVSLIDVEDMFGPGLMLTDGYPRGTDGYQHRISRQADIGQWCAEGDRFAGAVLLAEMITWHEKKIRNAAGEEHFFASNDLQDSTSPNYKLMVDVLTDTSSDLAKLFIQAWESSSLTECPPLSKWLNALNLADTIVHKWLPIGQPSELVEQVNEEQKPNFQMNQLAQIHSITRLAWRTDLIRWWPNNAGLLSLCLRWNPVAFATQYQLWWRHPSKTEKFQLVAVDNSLPLSSGFHYFRIRALDSRKQPQCDWSNELTVYVSHYDNDSRLTVEFDIKPLPAGSSFVPSVQTDAAKRQYTIDAEHDDVKGIKSQKVELTETDSAKIYSDIEKAGQTNKGSQVTESKQIDETPSVTVSQSETAQVPKTKNTQIRNAENNINQNIANLFYIDFDIKFVHKSGDWYHVESSWSDQSDLLYMDDEFKTKISSDDLNDWLISIFPNSSASIDIEQAHSWAKCFGQEIFQTIFSNNIGRNFASCQLRSRDKERPVRIRLNLEKAPNLIYYPWELLWDIADNKGFLAFSDETSIVRYKPPRPKKISVESSFPLHMLVVAANSDNNLRFDQEKDYLAEVLSPLESEGILKIDWLDDATPKRIREKLNKNRNIQILHYIGHGGISPDREGYLALHKSSEIPANRLNASQLASLLGKCPQLQLVTLNTCHSAHATIKSPFTNLAWMLIAVSNIPAVVAMQHEIYDSRAIQFSEIFYRVLAEGQSIDRAMSEARLALYSDNGSDLAWAIPALYTRLPDGIIFKRPANADIPGSTPIQ